MASGVRRATHEILLSVARSCHSLTRTDAHVGAARRVLAAPSSSNCKLSTASISGLCSHLRGFSTNSQDESAPAAETSSSTDTGKGQWRKWIEVKLASKDRKGGQAANDLPPSGNRNEHVSSGEVFKAGQKIAENFDSVDDFERRVLGTAWRPGNDDEDDLLKQLDAIDRVSGGSAGASPELEQDNFVYGGRAGWEEDRQPMNGLSGRSLETWDVDSPDNPYQIRPDRLFFPGQSYLPEDLDISRSEPEGEKTATKPRKVVDNGEVLRKADFRNPRYLSVFLTETSKISPKRRNHISAKAQRKVNREIKTARILGLLPFTTMGQGPQKFRRPGFDVDRESSPKQ